MYKRKRSFYEKYIKRQLDFIGALISIIVLSPILLIISLLVLINLGTPIIFTQKRPGKDCRIFKLYKFRSMNDEKDENGNLLPDEKRLGKFGKLLRSTSLDELPELINILQGTLSFVGPRPQLVRDLTFMTDEQKRRHEVIPGLTGLAQCNGRNNMTWEKKFEYDLRYIEKITFIDDIKIILKTFVKVFIREGINEEGMATAMDFGDYLLSIGKIDKKEYDNKQEQAKLLLAEKNKFNKNEWEFYNHAIIPNTPPHINNDISNIEDDLIWKYDKKALLARWITEFDIGYETNWWYVIKDSPFDIQDLKAKRRYEINKGKKNFEVREIIPKEYTKELYKVTVEAYTGYPKKYRPSIDYKNFIESLNKWNWYKVYGAFNRENGSLCGYALLNKKDKCIEFNVLRTNPDCEKRGINAAIVNMILGEHDEFLCNDGYISDGARSINHETNFQDYLEKYFGFRKAYCKLNIRYNPKIKWIIKCLYPMRKLMYKMDSSGFIHKINAILKMEEIARS